MGQMSPAPAPHPHTSESSSPTAADTKGCQLHDPLHSGNPLEQQWAPDGQQSSYCPAPALAHISLLAGYTTSPTQLALPCSQLSQTTFLCLQHSPSHEPAAFVGFLGGSWWETTGQPDGREPIPTSEHHTKHSSLILCSLLRTLRRQPQEGHCSPGETRDFQGRGKAERPC